MCKRDDYILIGNTTDETTDETDEYRAAQSGLQNRNARVSTAEATLLVCEPFSRRVHSVNHPPYSITADAVILEGGAPASKTRFAGTVSSLVGSAVSTGVRKSGSAFRSLLESKALQWSANRRFASTPESQSDSEDVDSELPAPTCLIPRERLSHR